MANGLIDTSTLTPLPAQPHLRLRATAAAAWVALAAAVLAAYGWVLTATDAYRDRATQERIFRQRYTTTYLPGRPRKSWLGRWWYLKAGYAAAAVPGTSNHGLGITVDVANLGGFGSTKYRQFAALAEPAGWSNAEGRSINEFWHWSHLGGGSVVTNPIGGGGGTLPGVDVTPPTPIAKDWFDMATRDDLKVALREVLTEQGVDQDGINGIVYRLLKAPEITQADLDRVELALRQQFAPSGEAHKRLAAMIPAAVWEHELTYTNGTKAKAWQVLRDAREIGRRLEARWRKFVGLPADPTEGA